MELVNKDHSTWKLPKTAVSRIGKGQINDVKFSSDGKLLVVASSVGIWLYDVNTGKELDLLTEHIGSVNALAFSPNGRTFASGGEDAIIHLWDLTTKSLLSTFKGHDASVDTLAFSPEGTILASANRVRTDKVRFWDVNSLSECTHPLDYLTSASTIAFSPNGEILAIVNGDGRIHFYSTLTGSAFTSYIPQHESWVNALSYSPNGMVLASGSSDNTIFLRDAETGEIKVKLTQHANSIVCLVHSPGGETLASADWNGILRLWDANTGKELYSLNGHSGRINALAFSGDGSTLVSGGDDGILRFWNVVTTQEKVTITGHTSEVIGPIVFSPDGRLLAIQVLFGDKTLKLLNVNTGQETYLSLDRPVGSRGLAFSVDCSILASGSFGEIHLWNIKTGAYFTTLGNRKKTSTTQKIATRILKMPPLDGHTDWVNTLVFSPNYHFLASGSADNTIRLWGLSDGVEVSLPGRHEDWVSSLVFSDDSRLLASGSKDGRIRIWNIENLFAHVNFDRTGLKPNMNREESPLGKHEEGVCSLSFSSDGRVLASGTEDGTIQLWDVFANCPISTLKGHTGWVYTLMFLCNDDVLVSGGGGDNTIRLWDTFTGQEIKILTGHTAPVRTLAFLSDSKILASAGNDGTIYLWDWKKIVASET